MIICEADVCTGCGTCALVCPVNAVDMREDDKGFLTPVIDGERCIGCHKCVTNCHVNTYQSKNNEIRKSYSACAKDIEVRKNASSGAVVTVLAQHIFNHNGAVVGAIFDENQHLYQAIAYSEQEYVVKGFSRSKYVQSDNRECFKEVKKYLANHDAPLLFVGTPCQNAALTTYLQGKKYPNLYQVDFVCHGVPSPGLYHSYCRYLEKKYASQIEKIDFRVKKPSWQLSSTVYTFKNKKKYVGNMLEDWYNVLFATYDNSIRESCMNCKYACPQRTTDITVCDYWGKRDIHIVPDEEQNGVSAVIVNTEQGLKLFESISDQIICGEVSYESIQKGNYRLEKSRVEAPERENFWRDYKAGMDWPELAKRYAVSVMKGFSLKQRILTIYRYQFPIKQVVEMYMRIKEFGQHGRKE